MKLIDLWYMILAFAPFLLFGWLLEVMLSSGGGASNPSGCAACGGDRPDDHDLDEPGWCDYCNGRINKEKK